MRCPFCKSKDTAVVDSRASEDGFSIRRRRQCSHCGKRFTTFERVEINMPAIGKRTGVRREYDRDKVRGSMRLALRKRPVSDEQIEEAITFIENDFAVSGSGKSKAKRWANLCSRNSSVSIRSPTFALQASTSTWKIPKLSSA